MRLFFIFIFSFFLSDAYSQVSVLERWDSVKVKIGSDYIKYPWAGGINFGQFSEIDVNMDGKKDLFVFDRTGSSNSLQGKSIVFINEDSAGVVSYHHDASYQSAFPFLHEWALLVDFNCDGKEDIFTYNLGSVSVYKNTSTATALQFTLETADLVSNYNPGNIKLYVSSVDIPAIKDIDGDGDVDILTFSVAGSQVEFHKNMSKETYGNCDHLVYELVDKCYGSFTENASNNNVTLNANCTHLLSPDSANRTLHTGSCLTCVDLDGDADQDLLVGDVSFKNINALTNGGSSSSAFMTSQDPNYPSNSLPVNLAIFPCAYEVDVNNDGYKDLLFAPNASNVSENFKSVWFYRNTSTSGMEPGFVEDDFLQDGMIEVGEGAVPSFFDANSDGLLDLMIANDGYYVPSGTYTSSISYYQNTGTVSNPEFTLITRDYGNLSAFNMKSVYPSFGDLDGDSDLDMMVGDYDGKLHYFENTAAIGSPANFTLSQANYGGFDVGQYATPQLIDMDKDGKLDLIVGKKSGYINYYENKGSINIPNLTFVTDKLGNVRVNEAGFTSGYNKPFVYDSAGTYRMFVGSDRGYIFHYKNIDNNLGGTFTKTDSTYSNIFEGIRSSITGADLTNDGIMELVIGNYRGGVSYYKSTIHLVAGVKEFDFSKSIKVFPNPSNNIFNIKSDKDINGELQVLSITGQLLFQTSFTGNHTSVDASHLSDGVYILRIISKEGMTNIRIIKR